MKPKVGDRVRVTFEGKVTDVYFNGKYYCETQDGETYSDVEAEYIEVLKPEPKPGEAWVVRPGNGWEQVMLRSDGIWQSASGYYYQDDVTPIRRLIDPGEDEEPA